jgi:hypothetical protein
LLLPYYETIDDAKKNLSENDDDSGAIDKQRHQIEDSLVIIDGVKAHFKSDLDIVSFINRLVKHAQNIGKNSISVFVKTSIVAKSLDNY